MKLNINDIKKELDFYNHKSFWIDVFKPNKDGEYQKGILYSKFIEDKEKIIEICKEFNGKGLICVAINEREKNKTNSDDVKKIGVLVFDIDVKKERKVDYVSTQEDKEHSIKVSERLKQYLAEKGFSIDLIKDSGNGVQLLCKVSIDVENETKKKKWKEQITLIEKDLRDKFNDQIVEIDFITKDENRRLKLAGTINKKDTLQKEDRIAKIVYLNKNIDVDKNNKALCHYKINEKIKKSSQKTRSEIEFKLIIKELFKGYKEFDEIDKILINAKIGKWQESTEQYKEHQYKKALEYVNENKKDETKTGFTHNEQKDFYYIVKTSIKDGLKPQDALRRCEIQFENNFNWKNLNNEDKLEKIKNIYDTEKNYEIVSSKNHFNYDELLLEINKLTKHLENFDDFENDFYLRAKNKRIITKAYYYKFLARLQDPEGIDIGHYKTDNRPHFLIIASAGKGKGTLRNITSKFCQEMEIPEAKITSSISNPEQLIGKMIVEKEDKQINYIEHRGFLGKEEVDFDEAQDVLNEIKPIYADIQLKIRQAMDPYGTNKIRKELVNDKPEFVLEYCSPTHINYYIHPVPLLNVFFSRGTSRRFDFVCQIENDDELDIINIISFNKIHNTKNFEYLKKFNRKRVYQDLKENVFEEFEQEPSQILEYDSECLAVIETFIGATLKYLLTNEDEMITRFGLDNYNSIHLFFFKWINILHISKNLRTSDMEYTIAGLLDGFGFLMNKIKYLIKQGMSYQNKIEEWLGVEDDSILALKYLLEKNAVSKEKSNISIKDFKKVLSECHGVQDKQAEKIYNKLKSTGYIDSKQTGQYETKVWLKIIPSTLKIKDYDFRDTKGYKILSEKYMKIQGPQGPIDLNNISIKQFQGPQGPTDLTPLLNSIYVTYEAKNFLFYFINIYNNIFSKGGCKEGDPKDPEIEKNTPTKKEIKEFIKNNDMGEGTSRLEIINNFSVNNDFLDKLLLYGEAYESKTGYLKLL